MRYVDASTLNPVGNRDTGPWHLGDNRLLKTSAHGLPLRTEKDAQGVLDAYRMAYEADAGTPRPWEVVRAGDGFGVVVEYVQGMSMIPHVIFGSYTPQEAGQAMGVLMLRMHGAHVTEGRDVNADFRRYARALAPLLPSGVGDQLVSLVDVIPESPTLLHGDLHPGNVVVRRGVPTPIDMELAGFGHPILDLAITRARMLLGSDRGIKRGEARNLDRRTRRMVWESLLATYLDAADTEMLQDPDRMTTMLAEVERCCFNCEVAHNPYAPTTGSGNEFASARRSSARCWATSHLCDP